MRDDTANTGELVKFLLLVIALGMLLVGLGLAQPVLFGRVVPAVLGEGQSEPLPPLSMPTMPAPTATMMVATPAVTPLPTRAPTVVPPTQAPLFVTYTVQPGDNLIEIAEEYGVSVEELIRANNITDPNQIVVGTVLVIPAGSE
jgi:nucleoid-associated protein YgaU